MPVAPDDPNRIVACLKSLGLTKYEALVYIALLRVTGATATEIHEISGVPRASVYPVLEQLQAKELVSISQSSPKRFAALPPEQGIGNLLSRIQKNALHAKKDLLAIYKERSSPGREGQELIWNLYGITAIRKKIIDLLTHADHDVRIIAHPQLFSDDIKRALNHMAHQITVEIITPQWDGEPPGSMNVYVKKTPEIPKELDRAKDMMAGGVFLFDNRTVLVVVGLGKEDSVALYSESYGFVRFFNRYYDLIVDWAKKPDSQ
jgi:sugar-specific transcriptional regulator TrmB